MTPLAFSTDATVAERFRIVRLLGHGGMGEVYEAEDLTLRERVALKTVRAEVAGDPHALERLLHEVHLARKVTHANVCRIFDVFQHPAAPVEASPQVTFVSMELLAGETLAERLGRAGRMSTAEAAPIVRQIVDALAAAHKAGVVHRDLKTDNVALVPAPSEEGGLRVVVTDFGLARGRATEAGDASLTEVGLIVGTPAYMAPEQMEGHDVTAASDIYSLGVVIYEMVTGQLPFPGESVAAAARRLRERPASPCQHVPDLDPRWETVILRCLERDSIDRFASVTDVVRALAGEEVTPGRRALIRKHAREVQWQRIGRLGLGLGAILLAVLGGYFLSHRPPASPPTSAAARRSVAVLGFKNLSGRPDAAWLSTAFSEMLTAELAAGEALRLVPGESVARMKIDLVLPDTDTLAKDTLARVRKSLGTDLVVLGSYFAAGKEGGGKVRLDLRLQETAAGEMVASVSDAGTEAELLDLVSRAGVRLREKLGVGETTATEAKSLRAALPGSPEGARLYAEGLGKLRSFDALTARDLLEKAVAADPDSPLAHATLAEAWSALGYDGKAKEAAKRAFDLAENLSREDRLSVEGRYREAAKEWEKAVEIHQALWGFFPDDLDYGLRLASVLTSAGQGKEALATVEALRRLPPPARDDPRIDLAEASASESVSDFRLEQAVAEAAAKKGETQGARLVVAEARHLEARALWRLGELKRAQEAARQSQQLFDAAGDRSGAARALNVMANAVREQGDLDEGRRLFEESLAIGRAVGDKRRVASALGNVALVLSDQGDLDGARRLWEDALAVFREIGAKYNVALQLTNIAGVLSSQGDLAGAQKMNEEALAIWREIGDKWGVAVSLISLGDVSLAQGELTAAKTHQEQALARAREIGDKRGSAYALSGLGDVLSAEGDLATARKKHEEALAIRNDMGEKGRAAESRLALATLSIEEGKPGEAEKPAREASQEFQKEKQTDNEALAYAVLARSFLEQGKTTEAEGAINSALKLSARSQTPSLRMSVAIAAARIRSAGGESTPAIERLRRAVLEATKLGFVGLRFEALLALGEIEVASGAAAAGRTRLEALEKDASAKGFGLVARKARKAAS